MTMDEMAADLAAVGYSWGAFHKEFKRFSPPGSIKAYLAHCSDSVYALHNAFDWSGTMGGHSHWSYLYERLLELKEGALLHNGTPPKKAEPEPHMQLFPNSQFGFGASEEQLREPSSFWSKYED